MYKISFTLKQHTPLIHFQHDQEGATLRASEVKPKLDRFLLEKRSIMDTIPSEAITHSQQDSSVSIGYQIRINTIGQPLINEDLPNNYPCFFGNMKKTGLQRKWQILYDSMIVNIQSSYIEVIKAIGANVCEFFNVNNFGSRQSKGFGSFYPDPSSKIFVDNTYQFKAPIGEFAFSVANTTRDKEQQVNNLFTYIDYFYRSIRSGINIKGTANWSIITIKGIDYALISRSEDFYFKSLLFLYLLRKGIQWDKKTIKEELLPRSIYIRRRPTNKESEKLNSAQFAICDKAYIFENNLQRQKQIYVKSELFADIQAPETELRLYRDLFGLSSDEQWLSYSRNLKKRHAKSDDLDSESFMPIDPKSDEAINRIPSPVFIKPVLTETGYKVIISIRKTPEQIKDQAFILEFSENENTVLALDGSFDFNDFFKWIFDKKNVNITTYIKKGQPDTRKIGEKLINIYSQLQK